MVAAVEEDLGLLTGCCDEVCGAEDPVCEEECEMSSLCRPVE